MKRILQGAALAAIIFLVPAYSFAACSFSGVAFTGDMIIGMKGVGSPPGIGRIKAGTSAGDGDVTYNRANNRMVVCDGNNWVNPDGSTLTSSAGAPGTGSSAPGGMTVEIIALPNSSWTPRFTGSVEFIAVGGGGGGDDNVSYGGSAGAVCHKTLSITNRSASFNIGIGGGGAAGGHAVKSGTGGNNTQYTSMTATNGGSTTVKGPGINMTAGGGGRGASSAQSGGSCSGADYGFTGGKGRSNRMGGPIALGYRGHNTNSTNVAIPDAYLHVAPSSINPFTGKAFGNGGFGVNGVQDTRTTVNGDTGSGGASIPNGGYSYRSSGGETYQIKRAGFGGQGVVWVIYRPE